MSSMALRPGRPRETGEDYGMAFQALGRVAVAAAIAALPAAAAHADFNDKKAINYTVDGATASGYFKVVAEAVNGIVREYYPGSAATYKPGSPAGGILNLSRGQSDFTFTAGAPEIAFALEGKAPFTESLKGKFNFVMLIHNGLVVHNIMTKDWAERNRIKSFADIAAKKPQMRLHVNQLANLQSTLGMYGTIFDAYGIKEAEVTKGGGIFRSNAAGGLENLRDGKIDVFINGGFLPTAEIADINRGRALMWIAGAPDKIKAAAGRWGYDSMAVPKGVYPFVTQDDVTIVQWNAVVAGAHVSEETVYKFIKAMNDNRARVRSIHPSLAQFAVERVSRNPTPLPYHPGAARYYRDAGVLKQ
jgi:TRAP transporter TAXI family solute receptor